MEKGDSDKNFEDSNDLAEMVTRSQQDMDIMVKNLAKLRHLSKDDKTEAAMLRSRIDEQAQLIMILKQRADESLLSVRTLERINNELEEFKSSTQAELDQANKRYYLLDQRFSDLASNHQQLILIKDEYKRINEELRRENYKLRDDNEKLFSHALLKKNEEIAELDKRLAQSREQNHTLDTRLMEFQSAYKLAQDAHLAELKDLKKKLAESEERLKGANAKLIAQTEVKQTAEADLSNRLQALAKEKEEMQNLAISRGKLVQEKQVDIKRLEAKVAEMEKTAQNMEDKFEREASAVNANLQVRRLKSELSHVQQKYDQLNTDYDAFKKHSLQLIKREKEMNDRLQQMVS